MYKKSKDIKMHKRFVRNTRISKGIVFKRSPYFSGAKLWDDLPVGIIELPDVYIFKARMKSLNAVYIMIH